MAVGTAIGLAIAGGALAGSLGGAAISSRAAGSAARTQERAVESAADVQLQSQREASAAQLEGIERVLDFEREIFELGREDLAPFREAGQTAVGQLAGLAAPGGAIFEELGQQFQFGAEEFGDDPGPRPIRS